MKQISIFFVIVIFLAFGCQRTKVNKNLSVIDSLVFAEFNDSAFHLIMKMRESDFHTPEDLAHFYLLRVQTAYLVNQPLLSSDSLLDKVIAFYEQHHEKEKLIDAYYYRAIGTNSQRDYDKSIILYKKAEMLADISGNKRLQFKIAEGIAFVNGMCFNFDLQLRYAKRSLQLARELGKNDLIAYSCYRVAYGYSKKGNKDSAYYYSGLLMPYIDSVSEKERPVLLSSLGYLFRFDNPKQAKQFLQQSLSYEELTATYMYLAEISYNEGKPEEAYRYWKKGLKVQDATPKDNIIHNLIEYDLKRGKTDSICERINEIIAIRDSIDAKLKNDTIKDLQTRFDHEVAMREKDQTVIRWQWIAIILVILLLLVVVYYLVRKYQARILLQKSQMQINDYMEQIRELKSDQGDQTTEITRLNKEVKRIMDERSPRLSQGRMLYDKIVTSEKMSRWQKDDVRKVIEYCTAINYRMVNRLKSVPRQHQLTPHQLLYLILVEMGKSDLEILQILSISKETLRGLRHKTKPLDESGSEKTDESL